MRNPILSIIVPVYNSEIYLKECINSILQQNVIDFELLLINDGSTDKSGEICDIYKKKDDRIKVFHITNGGVSNARNYGISKAKGEWITFIDSDDFISSTYSQELYINLKKDVDIIIFNYTRYINSQKQETETLSLAEGEFNNVIDLYNLAIRLEVAALSVCTSIYKRDIIQRYNLKFDTSMKTCEDFLFSLQYYSYIHKFYIINKALYFYRQNLNSATSKRPLSHSNDYQLVFNKLSYIINSKTLEKKSLLIFQERWIRWILSLVANYKLQKIPNSLINEAIYNKPYYHVLLKFKPIKAKPIIEKILLYYKMNYTILWYYNSILFLKRALKRYKI